MSNQFRTPIIPSNVQFHGEKDTLDLKSICVYSAIGFFLGENTFYNGLKALKPGHEYNMAGDAIISATPYFNWHNTPRNISLQEATEEFKSVFDRLIKENVNNRKVILPLSGGLDSRSLAAGLKHAGAEVTSYSYSFDGGLNEGGYAKKIALAEKFPFNELIIPSGYLWNKIDQLATINGCYSEFTHPRQMAFIDEYAQWGDVFYLGHWGDVLFDNMQVSDDMPLNEQVDLILKKILKMGGKELGSSLWDAWGLDGKFSDYLYEEVYSLLNSINITNANARLRAFKSMFWATRWTSVNLAIFEKSKPIEVPYFENEMCEFICTLPESILGQRQIQIEYLKLYAPELAVIEWQEKRPFNLYNYKNNYPWITLPYRAFNKVKRMMQPKDFIQRNWELQFLGATNDHKLQQYLLNEDKLSDWIPKPLIQDFYNKFKNENPVYYAHAVSMLLTFSLFSKKSLGQ